MLVQSTNGCGKFKKNHLICITVLIYYGIFFVVMIGLYRTHSNVPQD